MTCTGNTAAAAAGALVLTLRVGLVGVSCGWLLCRQIQKKHRGWQEYIASGAVTLLLGFVISVLTAMVLGEAGLYRHRWLEWAILLTIALAGTLHGASVKALAYLRRHLVRSIPALAVFAFACTVIQILPDRGEWIAGGWDPGVYMNEGVALARTGTLHPDDDFFYNDLASEEQGVFTRTGKNRTERFPGVVVGPGREAFGFQFFRFTPSAIAVLYRCGGLPAACNVNTIAGLITVLVFLALIVHVSGVSHAFFAAVLLVSQPIWLYHLHTPVSEILHLMMIAGLGLVLPYRGKSTFAAGVTAALLLCLMLNRFSFLPFAGFFIFMLSWLDMQRTDRTRVWKERISQFGSVALGAVVDTAIAPASIGGWSVMPKLLIVSGAAIAATLVVDLSAEAKPVRNWAGRLPAWLSWLLGAGALLLGLWIFRAGRHNPTAPDIDNPYHLVSYTGPALAVLACVGGLWLLCVRQTELAGLKGFVLFLMAVTLVVTVRNWVVDLYPWATRRYLACTVPMVAILASYPLSRLWTVERHRTVFRSGAAVILLFVLGTLAKPAWHAWSRTEYAGVSDLLQRVADRIEDDDIVIADHPWWGTPLACIYGKQVLNGRHFYRRGPDTMEQGMAALARLRNEGKRVRFLTSTDSGMGIFPLSVSPLQTDWTSGKTVLREMIHSNRATDFCVRDRELQFALHTLTDIRPPAEMIR